jgi:two-component sensor histidine kinase
MTESIWTRAIPAERLKWWQGQLLALLALAVAFVLRLSITPLIGGDRLPFVTLFPALLVATAVGGRWAGISALFGGSAVALWAFVPPVFAIDTSARSFWSVLAFLVSGGVIWLTAAVLRTTVLKFREKKALLEKEAAERERAAEQLRTVAGELEHRVRNVLSLIQGLVMQSARGVDSVDAYQKVLSDRLQALARVQSVVSDVGASSLPLPRILDDAVKPFAREGERFRFDGPEIMVPSDLALPLALAMHELSTNAVKYGALSGADGHVEVSWQETGGEVELEWKERDGPAVVPPERRGFGTRLLESALSAHQGRSKISYEADGVRYVATFAGAAGG